MRVCFFAFAAKYTLFICIVVVVLFENSYLATAHLCFGFAFRGFLIFCFSLVCFVFLFFFLGGFPFLDIIIILIF